MIGQSKLRNKIINQSTIILGKQYSGRKTVASFLGNKIGTVYTLPDNKTQTIREMLDYKSSEPMVFVVPDVDKAHINAKNILLKVLEEPINNIYYILICERLDDLLPTIISRCDIIQLEPYTTEEIYSYCGNREIAEIAETPYEADLLKEYNLQEFSNYVDLIIDRISSANIGNALKIAAMPYNITLFLRVVNNRLIERYKQTYNPNYLSAIMITNKHIGTEKLDGWIFDVREVL